MTHQEFTALVKSSDLEAQYALYIFANQRIRPHRPDIATILAARGEGIIPFLCTKMNAAQEVITVRNILFVFNEMVEHNYYQVARNSELMKIITLNISRFNDLSNSFTLQWYNQIQFSSDTYAESYQFSDCRCNKWVTTIFRNKDNLLNLYTAFDKETQFALLTCGKQAWQPATSWLRTYFVRMGVKAVPFLRSVLETSQDDIAINQAIALLNEMTCEKSYDVANDKELCKLLLETLKKLPKSESRDRYEEWVKKMIRYGS